MRRITKPEPVSIDGTNITLADVCKQLVLTSPLLASVPAAKLAREAIDALDLNCDMEDAAYDALRAAVESDQAPPRIVATRATQDGQQVQQVLSNYALLPLWNAVLEAEIVEEQD